MEYGKTYGQQQNTDGIVRTPEHLPDFLLYLIIDMLDLRDEVLPHALHASFW